MDTFISTPEMPYNTPLLRKAIEAIEAEPATWNQSYWAQKTDCGTVFCLAGHIAVAAGYPPVFGRGDTEACDIADETGNLRYIPMAAAELVGFSEGEKDRLFYDTNLNTPAELRAAVEEVVGERL